MTFARETGVASLTRTVVTTTGRTVYNIFDGSLVGAVRVANAAGQTVREAIEGVLTPARITSIVNFLFNESEQQTLVAIRDGVRNLLSDLQGPRLAYAAEAAMHVVETSRSEFATLGEQGIRQRLLDRMAVMYNSFTDAVDNLFGRMTGAGVSNATRDLAEQLAERLVPIADNITDDALIRTMIRDAIQAVAPAEAGNQQLITTVRNLLVVRSLPGANSALRTLGEQLANRAKQLYATLTQWEMDHTTIAVSRIRANGQWVEVVTVNATAPESVVTRIRTAIESEGGIFRRATGSGPRGHAETFLYREFHMRDGFEAIGISHKDGPCPGCLPMLRDLQFTNVYWAYTIVPAAQ